MKKCVCVAVYGHDVKAAAEQPLDDQPPHPGRNTVTYEARLLKSLLMQLV
jgi:tetratricopeptide repeat protein 30